LKETLKILNDYVETQKKEGPPCQKEKFCEVVEKKGKCCEEEKKDNECCCECESAKCVIAACDPCDAPEINKLLNVVYTPIPHFPFPESGALVNLTTPSTYNPVFNYYVTLPCDQECGEVRLLWPFVWMIKEVVNRLAGRFTRSGFVTVKFILNVLSKKLIKDPAQLIPTLNVGGVTNGPCICETANAAQFDYTFNLRYEVVGDATFATLASGSSVVFSYPNNSKLFDPIVLGVPATFLIEPSTLELILPIRASPEFDLVFLGIQASILALVHIVSDCCNSSLDIEPTINIPEVIGFIRVNSPALYFSFIPSIDNDGYWVATNLENLNV
jgi:hypothetical protein